MKKEIFTKACDIQYELEKINKILLPEQIIDVDLVRDDGVVIPWDGSVIAKPPTRFDIAGGADHYGRYFISINRLNLTAKESQMIINVIKSILDKRVKELSSEFENL
jgi:hypothetical protein